MLNVELSSSFCLSVKDYKIEESLVLYKMKQDLCQFELWTTASIIIVSRRFQLYINCMMKSPADSISREDINCNESLNKEENVFNLEEKTWTQSILKLWSI